MQQHKEICKDRVVWFKSLCDMCGDEKNKREDEMGRVIIGGRDKLFDEFLVAKKSYLILNLKK